MASSDDNSKEAVESVVDSEAAVVQAEEAQDAGDIGDIMEEPEGDGLLVSLSREAGVVAQRISSQFRGASARFARKQKITATRQAKHDLHALLESLGRLVEQHGPQSYRSLEHQAEFWRLINLLSSVSRLRRGKAGGGLKTVRKRPAAKKKRRAVAARSAAHPASPTAAVDDDEQSTVEESAPSVEQTPAGEVETAAAHAESGEAEPSPAGAASSADESGGVGAGDDEAVGKSDSSGKGDDKGGGGQAADEK